MNIRILSLAGAMAATSALASISFTNSTPYVGAGELVLGFMAAGGQGATLNLQVALGTQAAYAGWQDGKAHLLSQLRAQDLADAYGSGWSQRTDLSFGIVGFSGSATKNTAWYSKRETTPGTLSTPWTRTIAAAQNTPATVIKALYAGMAHADANSTTPGGSAVIFDSASPVLPEVQAWKNMMGSPNAFKSAAPIVFFANDMTTTVGPWTNPDGAATEVAVSDVWKLDSGSSGQPGSLMGVFGLDKTGKMWYASNPQAFTPVPEPSTYGLIGAGALLAIVGYRRFSKKA
jgi:hypothetical protein